MVIIITGTPGTGKSTYAKELGVREARTVVSITGLLKQRGLDGEWDARRHCFLVDVEELTRILEDLAVSDPSLIIDGHLSHHIDPKYVERCVVMKCALPELKRRLESRGYPPEKVRENLDCEIFDVCHVEALEFGHTCDVQWTSQEPEEI